MKLFKRIASILAVCVAAIAVGCTFCACIPSCKPSVRLSPLVAEGSSVYDGSGNEVWLRGVNAGGLFVTEHWMTGFSYGSTDSNDFLSLTRTLVKRFGKDKTVGLWKEYRSCWWSDVDFANCEAMGMNVVRLPFTYMNVDFDAAIDMKDAGKHYDFSDIEEFVDTAAEYGLYTILDLHGAYGSQNGQDHSGQIIGSADQVGFYTDETLTDLTVRLWAALAEHFRDNPNVAGYDILNEPGEKGGQTGELHWSFYDRVYWAIRGAGDEHIVIFESCWDGYNLPQPSRYGWENCMYSFHHYAKDTLSAEEHLDDWKDKLAEIEGCNFNVPLQMGEFTCYADVQKWEDSLTLLNGSGWHWANWTYKVWGNMPWGIVNVRAKNGDRVNVAEDDYDAMLGKFETLRTETCVQYTFDNGAKLADVIKKYCRSGG